MSKGTPTRPIRLTDELWAAAKAKAAEQGTTASEVIRALLTDWVEGDTPNKLGHTTLD